MKSYINKYINLEEAKQEMIDKINHQDKDEVENKIINDEVENKINNDEIENEINNDENDININLTNEIISEEKDTDIISEEDLESEYTKDLDNTYSKYLEDDNLLYSDDESIKHIRSKKKKQKHEDLEDDKLLYSDDESIKHIRSKKKQLKYDDEAYLYYLLNRKNYTNTLLHSVMSNIKNKDNFINENHFLSYMAMNDRIEKRDIKIPHHHNYSSTVHEYFINTDDNYKRKCNSTYDWKVRPTYLFRNKVNTFLLDYYYRVYSKKRHHHHHHHHHHRHRSRHHSTNGYNSNNEMDIYGNDFDVDNLSEDFNKNILLEEHTLPTIEDYKKNQENKFLKLIRLIFINIANDKCIYKNKNLIILLNDLIEIIQEPFVGVNCVDFSKLKKKILSDFQLNNSYQNNVEEKN